MATDTGSRESFWRAVSPQTSWIHRQLRRLGVHSRDLEDVTQEVMLAVFRRWDEFDPDRPIRPWLFAFAFREASTYRNRAAHRNEVPGSHDAPDDRDDGADVQLERQQARALVIEAMSSIDLDRRAVFILVDVEETPVPEVARSLGLGLNTAYSRLRLAREEFAAAVKRLSIARGRP
jgi:RNA polymerase sigma-70 factor (ECF subfamily)